MTQVIQSLVFDHWTRILSVPLTLGLLYLLSICFYNVFLHPLRKYPGPKLWAASRAFHARMMFSGDANKKILELHKRYGDVVRVAPNELSFVKPEAWNEIMGHRKRSRGENGKDQVFWATLIKSIIAVDHDNHRRMRKILSSGFSAQSMKDQQPIIQSYVDLLMQKLHQNCGGGKQPVEITSWYNWTTFDIIGDLVFGEPFGCLENSEYHAWVAYIFQRLRGVSIRQALAHFPFGVKFLRLLMSKTTLRGYRSHIRFTHDKVDKRLAQPGSRPDFVDAMTKRSDGLNMTYEEIIDNCSFMIIAGSETSATALCGVTYFLTTEPEVLQKVADEVRSSFTSEAEIDMYSVSKLSYMLAVLNEALRLLPSVPNSMPRRAQRGGDTIFGQYIPEDTILSIPQYAMYHMPGNFVQTESFIPERWLGDARFKEDAKDAFQPFSFGPRDCIGKNLAYAEMRLILAKILWNFDMKIHPDSRGWVEGHKAYFLYDKPEMDIYLTPRITD